MESNRRTGSGEKPQMERDRDRLLGRELLDFVHSRLPEFAWLKETEGVDDVA